LLAIGPVNHAAAQSSEQRREDNESISTERVRECLYRGLDWLRSQQSDQGSWHSSTYGQMRPGAGNTALIVYALSSLDGEARDRFGKDRLQLAIQFLLSSLDAQGFVRSSGEATDYPTYSTALTLLALKRLDDSSFVKERSRLVAYLIKSQRSEQQSFNIYDPQYGAWDQTGGRDAATQISPQVDIAITAIVLEALQGEVGVDRSVFARAEVFLNRCQNLKKSAANSGQLHADVDGGFFFTTLAGDPRNKAGVVTSHDGLERPRSYSTATIDGMRALIACGVSDDDERVRRGSQWLTEHAEFDVVPGFIDEEAQRTWAIGLRFYYWAGLAQVLPLMPDTYRHQCRPELLQKLASLQRFDGSWENESHAMREDDPLIATAFAILTLSRLSGE
jgi:hypothetical protein